MKFKKLLIILTTILLTTLIFYGFIIYQFNAAVNESVKSIQAIAHDEEHEDVRTGLDSIKTLIESELDYPVFEKILESKDLEK